MNIATLAATALLSCAVGGLTSLAVADAAPSHHGGQSRPGHGYEVVATVNKTEPLEDSKIKISATVTPAAPGATVTLQVRYAEQKRWKTIDRGRLNQRGKVTFKDTVGSVRVRSYRVVKPADGRRAAGHSRPLKVTVFGWRDLTSLDPATSTNMTETADVHFGGVRYPDSLRSYYFGPQSPLVSIDYNLNRDCKSFRGVAGLDDSSPSGGAAVVALATDGTQRYSGSFALTQSAPVAFDITDVFRLTVAAANSGGGLGAVGTPQVLCSF